MKKIFDDKPTYVEHDTPFIINGTNYTMRKSCRNSNINFIINEDMCTIDACVYGKIQWHDIYNALHIKYDGCERTYSIGDLLYDKYMDNYHIITFVKAGTINLTCVTNGCRWAQPITVENINNITTDELKTLITVGREDFYYVGRASDYVEVKKC